MKIVYELNTEDEADMGRIYRHQVVDGMCMALWDLDQQLRQIYKYTDGDIAKIHLSEFGECELDVDTVGHIRQLIWQHMSENGVDLNEL